MNTPKEVKDFLRSYFKILRFSPTNHLGLGDIRLSTGQQEEIINTVYDLCCCEYRPKIFFEVLDPDKPLDWSSPTVKRLTEANENLVKALSSLQDELERLEKK